MNHPGRLAGAVLGCLILLNGCGGGGGGDSGGAPTTPTTPTTPPTSAVPSGNLWSSDSNIGDARATFRLDLVAGTTTKVGSETEDMPSTDGTRLLRRAYTSNGSVGSTTRITVLRTADGQTISDQQVDGYVGVLKSSPQAPNQVLTVWGESVSDSRSAVVYDLEQKKVLFATPPADLGDAVGWMPDGSLLRVKSSGAITKVVLGAAEQAVRTVTWPDSRVPQAVYVSPDGTKALVQLAALRDTGSVSGADLWMMNVDGSGLTRFTNNDLITNAFWSPDSKFVGFSKDTGFGCTGTTCFGSCTVWYAEATASNVVAAAASGDAKQFSVKKLNGSATNLSCPVMAWTR